MVCVRGGLALVRIGLLLPCPDSPSSHASGGLCCVVSTGWVGNVTILRIGENPAKFWGCWILCANEAYNSFVLPPLLPSHQNGGQVPSRASKALWDLLCLSSIFFHGSLPYSVFIIWKGFMSVVHVVCQGSKPRVRAFSHFLELLVP